METWASLSTVLLFALLMHIMEKSFKESALHYHEFPVPGKIATIITKLSKTQYDLSLAYSPGVAEPVLAIAANPDNVYRYTQKGNLVAVVSNGTAVLGLGNVGPLAAKPVMEGKGLLFKRLADIDVYDLEIDQQDPLKFIEVVSALEPTFAGINLEDIKAPECFLIESELKKRINIPVFHDDQHGTAIVLTAALKNALEIQKKEFSKIKIICVGAGAAGIACMHMLLHLGVRRNQIFMLDTKGLIVTSRDDLNNYKSFFAQELPFANLEQTMHNADVFIGLSSANLLTPSMVASMAPRPIIFAMANPNPEILPDIAHAVRDDIIIATGRSDYPNQVNNVLCFPFIFRGALDVRARQINEEMKVAACNALSELTKSPVPADVLASYNLNELSFGMNYIIPKPLDHRLKQYISRAVALAAVASGVAQIPLPEHYK